MEQRNPYPTVDIVLQQHDTVLMVARAKDPFKDMLALPGGFINRGETAEDAAIREAKEETSLEIEPLEILGVYSDPTRDPRGHVMSVVFVGLVINGKASAGDDAARLEWLPIADLVKSKNRIAFDHATILSDYIKWKSAGGTFWSTKRRSQ